MKMGSKATNMLSTVSVFQESTYSEYWLRPSFCWGLEQYVTIPREPGRSRNTSDTQLADILQVYRVTREAAFPRRVRKKKKHRLLVRSFQTSSFIVAFKVVVILSVWLLVRK